MVHSCCAIGCSKSSDIHKTLKFHRFPLKNLPLLQLWLRAVRRKDFTPSTSTKICSDHFVQDDYCGKSLKPTVVPSIFNFEARSWGKSSKKVLASEEDMSTLESKQSELLILSEVDTPQEQESFSKIDWNSIKELGLDSSQVEVHFEAATDSDSLEESKHISRSICREKGTQTFFLKCQMCVNAEDKFKLLRKQIKRRENKIGKLQNIIIQLKQQLADSKKRKIKLVGNSIVLLDVDNNNSSSNISIDEQY